MKRPLEIDYYTDILYVWAWIAQRRIEELHQQWGERMLHANVDGLLSRDEEGASWC